MLTVEEKVKSVIARENDSNVEIFAGASYKKTFHGIIDAVKATGHITDKQYEAASKILAYASGAAKSYHAVSDEGYDPWGDGEFQGGNDPSYDRM